MRWIRRPIKHRMKQTQQFPWFLRDLPWTRTPPQGFEIQIQHLLRAGLRYIQQHVSHPHHEQTDNPSLLCATVGLSDLVLNDHRKRDPEVLTVAPLHLPHQFFRHITAPHKRTGRERQKR